MILVVDKSKEEKEEMYKLFYTKEDIPSSTLNSDVEIININPVSKTEPIENFQSFYGC
jgi:hypothetical protein